MPTEQEVQASRSGTDRWFPLIGTIAVFALAISIVALVVQGSKEPKTQVEAGAGGTKTVEVVLSDLDISPATLDIPSGTKVTFNVKNEGAMEHDFKVNGTDGTDMLKPGASATFEATIAASVAAWCTVPGHREAGMEMDITASGGGTAAVGGSTAAGTGGVKTEASALPKVDLDADTGKGWKARDPLLAPVEPGNVHKVSLVATEEKLEIAPGVVQEMWTFNGMVPAPTLHGKVGDTFEVTLTNKGKVGHSLDFHASQTPMDTDMRTIQSGESLVYKFKAERAGIWMYHCGTAPVLHHIGNGMAGAVVIDPPDLKPVDKEYVMVQEDLYLSADGGPAPMDSMLADKWDLVAFNGYANQYVKSPITSAGPKDRVRIWVLDVGPSENSAFHIVGTQFDTVYKEGAYLLQPGPGQGGSQTLDLMPSQGGFVELNFAGDGTYAQVTHKFSSASKGAVALWKVGNVPDGVMGH